MVSKTKWYCSRCGELIVANIHSHLPDYFDSNIDKQWIVNEKCNKCGMVFMLYRNRKEIVQVCQRLTPKNKYEAESYDSLQ